MAHPWQNAGRSFGAFPNYCLQILFRIAYYLYSTSVKAQGSSKEEAMRTILLFIFPILFIVSLALTLSGVVQVRTEEEKLMDDLQRKTRQVAESMELSVRHALKGKNIKDANYLVEKFEARERLQGCAIYDRQGKIFSITKRLKGWGDRDTSYIKTFLYDKQGKGEAKQFNEYAVYTYVLPIVDEDTGDFLGLVEVIHDTSYVSNRMVDTWKHLSVTLVLLLASIFVIAFLLQRQIFTLPIQRLTQWFQLFQKGDVNDLQPLKEQGELGKLASEVEQLALSLRVAKRSISEHATLQLKQDDVWTEDKLKNLIHAKLIDHPLFVVSNREPFMHVFDNVTNAIKCIRPAGGVVTALHPILSACGGTWIAHGSGNADRQFVNSKDKLGVPPQDIRYILKRVWLSKEEEEGYYYGFSNEGLWPLCHNTHSRPTFRETDWVKYKEVNQKFADALLEELPSKSPLLFIQDYHFTLLPKLVKEKRPDAIIVLFWHIPWPTAEAFAICPYKNEILEGLLGCDLIGFHIPNHCNNFLDTANRMLESKIDMEKHSVVRHGKETLIRPFPISIDCVQVDELYTQETLLKMAKLRKEFFLENKIVALGVDRIDYTKGILERMAAVDRFLDKYPAYKHKFVFIQIGSPSRTHIKRYHDFMSEVDALVEKINWKHSDSQWSPIIYLKRHFSPEEIEPFYGMADLCLVSSLHDGMNLVAKEYVSAKKDFNGCLVLSQFTGAAKELSDALLINPYSIEEFADNIKTAVEMEETEKRRRMRNMKVVITENNVFRWAATIMTELSTLTKTDTIGKNGILVGKMGVN